MSKEIKKQENKARPIMIQGTASSSGKSLITAALCRIFHQDGYRVVPFKAQNMSNNSFVTRDGLEMGRAQVVQAYASGLEPDVNMNPVLIKPSSDTGSQVVIKGKPSFMMNASVWHETRGMLRATIKECYESLTAENEIMIIEGAGSPAEINLKKNDIVNMGMAKMADAPVIIVGDIDRGGVFASLVGTMALLDPDEKIRVKGFIINKFRGDVNLLKPGLDQLEKITGVPVLGVVPWVNHAIDEEDGVSDRFECNEYAASEIDICIIRLPHISNYTDFIPLEGVPGVTVRWCDKIDTFGFPDLLILPGTKATISDLKVLKEAGIADSIISYVKNGGTVLGVCGGFQMLGNEIFDPNHIESIIDREPGLGLLDMITTFSNEKHTVQRSVKIDGKCSWLFAGCDKVEVDGYEIHMGQSDYGPSSATFTCSATDRHNGQSNVNGCEMTECCGQENKMVNGISDLHGQILGTYLHGLFDSSEVTTSVINAIRSRKSLLPLNSAVVSRRTALNRDIDFLADVVRKSINMEALYLITGV